jgi:hypothetical protein
MTICKSFGLVFIGLAASEACRNSQTTLVLKHQPTKNYLEVAMTMNDTLVESPWADIVYSPAHPESLDSLFSGRIAGLCVPDFLTREECKALTQRVHEVEFEEYKDVWPPIDRFGITVFEYDRVGKQEYFRSVEEANRRTARITDGICNPVQRVMDWLSSLSPSTRVSLAHEDAYGPYFAGLLRRIESGTLLHIDFAPIEQPAWKVGQVDSQLTWNIYLDVPEEDPGIVHVWQKQWEPQDSACKIPDSYGYLPKVVENIPSAQITPRVGMLMIINTRNFHQVTPAAGTRLAISSAAGRMPDHDIVLWS